MFKIGYEIAQAQEFSQACNQWVRLDRTALEMKNNKDIRIAHQKYLHHPPGLGRENPQITQVKIDASTAGGITGMRDTQKILASIASDGKTTLFCKSLPEHYEYFISR